MDAPAQLAGETSKAFGAFRLYLELPPDVRALPRVAESLGKRWKSYRRTLERWCSKWRWVERVEAHEAEAFQASLASRHESIERVRQVFVERATLAADVVAAIAAGKLNGELGGDRDEDGVPYVKPSTRLQAAIRMLETAGVTIPRRVEISGPDGSELQVAARSAERALTDEQFAELCQLLEAAGDGPG